MRGIQYAAASRFNRCVSGILDHPHARVMTTEGVAHPYSSNTPPPSRGAFRPGLANRFAPKRRGRRECRVLAAPAVSCAKCTKESAHEHTGTVGASRHSLHNGFTAYAVLSPATNSSCHRHRRIEGFVRPGWANENLRRLDTSNGCQDHTVLPYASAPFVCASSIAHEPKPTLRIQSAPDAAASTASHPNVRDDGQRPSGG
jgi:hypothetical protein